MPKKFKKEDRKTIKKREIMREKPKIWISIVFVVVLLIGYMTVQFIEIGIDEGSPRGLILYGVLMLVISVVANIARYVLIQYRKANIVVESFGTMLEATPDMVALIDEDCRISFISREMARMAGLKNAESAIGLLLSEIFQNTEEINFAEILHEALNLEENKDKTMEIKTVGGEICYYKVNSVQMEGDVKGRLINITDVTAIMKARYEAENASKAKSDFLSKMSHEIRTPMNAILGMSELLLREKLDYTVVGKVETIRQSGTHLLSVINDILDLSKIESGKLEIMPNDYYFQSLVHDVSSIVKMRLGDSPIKFAVQTDPRIPGVLYGDILRIRQVLLNILTNAIKYTKKGNILLDIHCEFCGNGKGDEDSLNLVFRISDTGIGIKSADMAKLFDEFTQFDPIKNKGIEGTGLGLAITQNLVNMMGGKIEVASRYGTGSTFTVNLPQKFNKDSEVIGLDDFDGDIGGIMNKTNGYIEHSENPQTFTAPTAKILVVDDIPANLKVAEGLLEIYKIKADFSDSGKSALHAVQTTDDYDLIFIDHMMPDMDGIETTKRIRATGKNLPIIALTANTLIGAREMFLENGFNDFLSKPINIGKLNAILARWIPVEKQQTVPVSDISENAKLQTTEEINIPGIDTKQGIAYCGGNFLEILELFYEDAQAKIKQIAHSLESKNIRLYTTYTHAVKSSAANIGAKNISQLAKELENAGHKEDWDFINANNKVFIKELEKLIQDMGTACNFGKKIPEDNNINITKVEIIQALQELNAALDAFDSLIIDEKIAFLKPYIQFNPKMSDEIPQLLEQIIENVAIGEFDLAFEQINQARNILET
ncbi:MAG: ATP-binding protein [Defluviitaleaceae bacterium]|nr:ATP-binding protein [Defluviitaleaceae bacterium]